MKGKFPTHHWMNTKTKKDFQLFMQQDETVVFDYSCLSPYEAGQFHSKPAILHKTP